MADGQKSVDERLYSDLDSASNELSETEVQDIFEPSGYSTKVLQTTLLHNKHNKIIGN